MDRDAPANASAHPRLARSDRWSRSPRSSRSPEGRRRKDRDNEHGSSEAYCISAHGNTRRLVERQKGVASDPCRTSACIGKLPPPRVRPRIPGNDGGPVWSLYTHHALCCWSTVMRDELERWPRDRICPPIQIRGQPAQRQGPPTDTFAARSRYSRSGSLRCATGARRGPPAPPEMK